MTGSLRMPENDIGNALAMLSKLDKDERLFSRDIIAVECGCRTGSRCGCRKTEPRRAKNVQGQEVQKKAGDAA